MGRIWLSENGAIVTVGSSKIERIKKKFNVESLSETDHLFTFYIHAPDYRTIKRIMAMSPLWRVDDSTLLRIFPP